MTVGKCSVLIAAILLAGCHEQGRSVDSTIRDDGSIVSVPEICVVQNVSASTSSREDEKRSFRLRFRYLYEREPIHLLSLERHIAALRCADDPETAAHHVIAIGMLGQDSPEIREVLYATAGRFLKDYIPQRYDWPDDAAEFELYLDRLAEQELRGGSAISMSSYPCNRNAFMLMLIDECFKRIEKH